MSDLLLIQKLMAQENVTFSRDDERIIREAERLADSATGPFAPETPADATLELIESIHEDTRAERVENIQHWLWVNIQMRLHDVLGGLQWSDLCQTAFYDEYAVADTIRIPTADDFAAMDAEEKENQEAVSP